MSQSSGKRRASVGVLFWIAFILLVLVIFLANRSNIEQVLESTGIVEVVRDRFSTEEEPSPAEPEAVQPESEPGAEPPAEQAPSPVSEPRVVIEPSRDAEPAAEAPAEEAPAPSDETEPTRDEPSAQPATPTDSSPSAQRAPSPIPEKPNRLMAGLYFIRVTDDGRTYPQRVVRPVYYATSPLTETIEALISGPSGDQLDEGLLNLIPEGTRLISAHVQAGTAFLNFNQSFRFNPLGAEGTVAQLLQVIYSSTEFPTVERVQFLVEGEEVDYLGGDGIYIGEPLGRDAFSS
ncbi:MAG TPA: GerMN domain-containing protein [Spirochaetia bacterium]|nr:GerMN domain-containing protein [Spirochaetia bacterium]